MNCDKLFDFVVDEVRSAGGDGDGTVVFSESNIQEVARQFEEWMKKDQFLSRWPLKRIDYSAQSVLFSDMSNENIHFVSKAESEKAKTGWQQEVWLWVW